MKIDLKKASWFIFWIVLVLSGPITILRTPHLKTIIERSDLLINLILRLVGLIAFVLIFYQIIVGAFMDKLIKWLGKWIFDFHIFEGVIAYSLIFLHPLLLVLFKFRVSRAFDPFYVFTDFCALCQTKPEYFLTLGRVAFWLFTVSVFAAIFRKSQSLKKNWRKLHVLNYFTFFLVAIHAYFLGSDRGRVPFVLVYWSSLAIVFTTSLFKFRSFLKSR
jgi:predicted ferric reductase